MNRAENEKVIHFPAGTRRYSDTIMQVSMPVETHDITQVGPLLKSIDTLGIPAEVEVLVTLDAVRIWREAVRDKEMEAARLPHERSEKPARDAGGCLREKSPLTLEEPGDVIIERARQNHEAVVLK